MYLLICYVDHSILYEVIFQFFEGSNSTGAKPYSRPSTLLSTRANVPVAPVESAPMGFSTCSTPFSNDIPVLSNRFSRCRHKGLC